MTGLPISQETFLSGSANIVYTVLDPSWRPAVEAPEELCISLDHPHLRRSRTLWLLRGEYRYKDFGDPHEDKDEHEAVWKIDAPHLVLGHAIFPLARFTGINREGKEYEQWLPTGEHYFVSLDYGRGDVFPCQYWRKVDPPPIPIGVKDEGYEWGTRYLYEPNFESIPGQSKWLKDLRRSPNCERPSWEVIEENKKP